ADGRGEVQVWLIEHLDHGTPRKVAKLAGDGFTASYLRFGRRPDSPIPELDLTLVHGQVANDTPAFPQQHCGRWNTMPGVITAKLVWSTVREGVIEQRANLCAKLSARVNVICLDQLDHHDNSDLSVGSSQ